MVGGFIRWDKLFDGSPTQDGKEVAERGAFAPVVEYDDQTSAKPASQASSISTRAPALPAKAAGIMSCSMTA